MTTKRNQAAPASAPAPDQTSTSFAEAATPEDEKKLIAVLSVSLKDRMDACRRLGIVGTKDAVQPLARLLADEELSHMARYGLEPIPDPAVDDVLRDALGKLKGRPLVGVIGSLGVRRDPKAVEPLSRLLQNSDADVVRAAARSLGRIGTPEAARALKERLATAPPETRLAVADGCLGCAERLMAAEGGRGEAQALRESVAKADLPEYVRRAAESAGGRTL